VATDPDGPQAAIYRDIAAKVRVGLAGGASRPTPRIVIEA
jgi:ATP-binding protein involved in chromosome partitioning